MAQNHPGVRPERTPHISKVMLSGTINGTKMMIINGDDRCDNKGINIRISGEKKSKESQLGSKIEEKSARSATVRHVKIRPRNKVTVYTKEKQKLELSVDMTKATILRRLTFWQTPPGRRTQLLLLATTVSPS